MSRLTLTGRRHAALFAGDAFLICLFLWDTAALPQDAHQLSPAEQAHIDEVLESVGRGHSIDQVAVSPDGKRLAWVEEESEGEEIRVAAMGELDKSERVTAAAPDESCDESEIAWSPDSASLAFFSNCAREGGQPDLYLSQLDGKPARRLTELHGYVDAPAFSPNGQEIAFLYVKGATRPAGALAAETPPAGVIGENDVEVQGVAVTRIAADAPNASLVTPAKLHVYEFDWSPDSKSLAYIAADPPGQNNWWVARLYTQLLNYPVENLGAPKADPGKPKIILAPSEISGPLHGLQIAVPRWSPDGRLIAFIGGLMSDQGVTGGDVWTIPASGGEPRDVTPGWPSTPAWIAWDGERHLYVDEIAGSDCRLIRLLLRGDRDEPNIAAAASRTVFSFPGTVGDGRLEFSLSSTADHSLFVFRASTYDRPTEIYAVRSGDARGAAGVTQLTHLNRGVEPAWGRSVSVNWKNNGIQVQGWLLLPKGYGEAKNHPSAKYPLLVEVHGGPASAVVPRWERGDPLSPQSFSALGYFVLEPNPRGSYGQGEAFTQANRKDFGYGDLRDIVAGVEAVEARYPIDGGRVGLAGWSYGGFMTMFAITQTHRFKAAVAGAGISDWLSYYGENFIDQWMIPFFGASVYDDPSVYAKSSAIDFIKQARTPTLVVVGDRDGECPAPQSFEFWHALRDLHVPTELVVYPNEGHGFDNPAHRRDVLERAAEWFARYMPAGG